MLRRVMGLPCACHWQDDLADAIIVVFAVVVIVAIYFGWLS